MNNDLTVFWHNNERTYTLLEGSERGSFDDDFLA